MLYFLNTVNVMNNNTYIYKNRYKNQNHDKSNTITGGLSTNVFAELLKISYNDSNQAIRNINLTYAYIGNHAEIRFAFREGVTPKRG